MNEIENRNKLINIIKNLIQGAKIVKHEEIPYFIISLDVYEHFFPELSPFILRIKNELNKNNILK